jgi:surface antigen
MLVAACGSNKGQGSVTGSLTQDGGRARAASQFSHSVIGGIGANDIGRGMAGQERLIAADAEYRALEYGQSGTPIEWTDPANHQHGSIVPDKPYLEGNHYCRAYTHTIYGSAPPLTAKGTACRDPDGTWRNVG